MASCMFLKQCSEASCSLEKPLCRAAWGRFYSVEIVSMYVSNRQAMNRNWVCGSIWLHVLNFIPDGDALHFNVRITHLSIGREIFFGWGYYFTFLRNYFKGHSHKILLEIVLVFLTFTTWWRSCHHQTHKQISCIYWELLIIKINMHHLVYGWAVFIPIFLCIEHKYFWDLRINKLDGCRIMIPIIDVSLPSCMMTLGPIFFRNSAKKKCLKLEELNRSHHSRKKIYQRTWTF